MDSTQNIAAPLLNNSNLGLSNPGLGSILTDPYQNASSTPQATRRTLAPAQSADLTRIAQEEGASHLTPFIQAIYGQESGGGQNAVTSKDGARGGMQLMPGTFKQYAKPGESIDNPEDNMRAGVRLIKSLGDQTGNDYAKMATGYFSGAGNINPGDGNAWRNDAKDGNGKSTSAYVQDVLARAGAYKAPDATPAGPVDMTGVPKWADVVQRPAYIKLSDAQKAEAKEVYFDHFIAPRVGDQAGDLRARFLSAANPTVPDPMEGKAAWGVYRTGVKSGNAPGQVPGASVMNDQPPLPELPTTSKVPVTTEVRQQFANAYASASPADRAKMALAPGWTGQLAREQQGLFQQADANPNASPTLQSVDPRAENRAASLAAAGADPAYATVAGQVGAAAGTPPGQEANALGGTAQASNYDFATHNLFNPDKEGNGLNNYVARGAAKAGLGVAKAVTGYNQFLGDITGLNSGADTMKGWSASLRAKEDAIGDPSDFKTTSYLGSQFENVIHSIGENLPQMALGVGLGSSAASLGAMALQTFGQEYTDGRAKGQTMQDATTRGVMYAAFEVLGEMLHVHQDQDLIRMIIHGGKTVEEMKNLFVDAIKHDIPGEEFTTAGEFATDKLPNGVGQNPNATATDYLKQALDTAVTTVGQGVIMGAVGHVRAAIGGHMTDTGMAMQAEGAKQEALAKWQQFREQMQDKGLAPAPGEAPTQAPTKVPGIIPGAAAGAVGAISPSGQVAPTPTPPAHQAEADAIVKDLAEQHGIPLETVMPSTKPPVAHEDNTTSNVTDQEVLKFADARFQQLREKSQGNEDTGAPAQPLSPAENHELETLVAARNNPLALRQLYGFDQHQEQSNESQAPSKGQDNGPASGSETGPVATGQGAENAATGGNGQPRGRPAGSEPNATGPAADDHRASGERQPGGRPAGEQSDAASPAAPDAAGEHVGRGADQQVAGRDAVSEKFDPKGLKPGTQEYNDAVDAWTKERDAARQQQQADAQKAENQAAVDKKNGWRQRLIDWFDGAKDGDKITTDIEGDEYRVVERTIERNGKRVEQKRLVEVDGHGNGQDKTIIEYRNGQPYQVPNTKQGLNDFAGNSEEPETDNDSRAATLGKLLEDGVAKAGSQETELERETRLEREAIQGEGDNSQAAEDDSRIPFANGPTLDGRTTDDLRQQLRGASDRTIQRQIADELRRRKVEVGPLPEVKPTENQADVPQPAQPGTQAEQTQGAQGAQEGGAGAPVAPKTEKEAKTKKALDRIATGTAYFGTTDKAQAFIDNNGLANTHQVAQATPNRWDVVPKNSATTEQKNGTQAPQAKQAKAQGQEAAQPAVKTTPGADNIEGEPKRPGALEASDNGATDGASRLRNENERAIRDEGAKAFTNGDKRGMPPPFLTGRSFELWHEGWEAARAKVEAAQPKTEKEAKEQKAKEGEFINTPEGSIDFGEITPEMSKAMRRQAGKIRLRRGNEAWGLTHIELRHADQFKKLGYPSAHAFVAAIAKNFDAIYKRDKSGLDVVVEAGKRGRLVVQLEPSENGDFYDVKTASPIRDEQFKNKKPLWERTGTSAPTVENSPPSPEGQNGNDSVPATQAPVTPNKIFTEEAANAARERLKAKLGRLNSGIDPETMLDGITLAGYHIEKGARTFAAYAQAMIGDLGEAVKPYLKSWYMGVKYDPRAASFEGMDKAADVEAHDVDKLAPSPAPAVEPTSTKPKTGEKIDLFTPEGKFKVAQHIADFLVGQGAFKTILEARKMISEFTGSGPIEAATERAKQADEAVEVGVVLAAREIVKAGIKQDRSPDVIYQRLVDLYARQPNLAVRSSTSVRDQAYSTPVPLAYVASQLAHITPQTTVMESTAGNGALLIGATPAKAVVNELNPKRGAMLDAMGFRTTQLNAATEKLRHAGYPVDSVIINPPFGVTKDEKGETIVYPVKSNYGTREVDHAIVFNTLANMKDDGHAVLIVGGSMSTAEEARREDYRGKNKRAFYFNLYNDYKVVDHFTVDGDLYAKQGAGYPVDVIVINGRGKSERALPAAELPQIIGSWDQLKGKLNETATGGVEAANTNRVESDRGDGATRGTDGKPVAVGVEGAGQRPGDEGRKPGTGDAAGVQSNGSVQRGRPDIRGTDHGGSQHGAADAPVLPEPGRGAVSGAGAGAGQNDRGTNGNAGDGEQRDRGNRLLDLGGSSLVSGERAQSGLSDRRGQEQETESQIGYEPHSAAASVGTLVPRAMAQSIHDSLNKLQDEVGDLDQYVSNALGMEPEDLNSHFSAEQVDALALGIKNAEEGKGFIIGDQTGIGKGRVVAAMIRYALLQGKTPIFVTEKPNLYSDMIRDLDDIGMTNELALDTKRPRIFMTNDETVPYSLVRMVNGEPVESQFNLTPPARKQALAALMQRLGAEGNLGQHKVIFTTYSQLQNVAGKATERQRFVQSLGADNYMIFDESHNAGGAGEQQARSKKQREAQKETGSTITGRAGFVRSLVNKAFGTFFSSATYAKRPDVMDLYSSTNMRLAVDKLSALATAIKQGGVPMQQVVANMLTKDGQYIRRERTFAGVSYDTKEAPVNKGTAENMASAMRSILRFSRAKDAVVKAMQKEMDKEGKVAREMGGAKASIEGANFGATMHNLIDQMLLALKADSAVNHAIDRLKAGEKVVLTVSNTMGSFLKQYAEDLGIKKGDPVALTFKDLYDRYLEKQRMVSIKDPHGNITQHRLSDAELGPNLVAMFKSIREQIATAGFGSAPISPIDYMHEQLRKAGFSSEEITGRDQVLNYSSGTPILSSRSATIKQRVGAVRNFNSGKTDVIILNQSGSTGLSLHASSKFADQRKRHMIVVQAEKNIDTHMQMLGRVHRTGQVVAPAYSQMMADIPAEMRPAAVLLKKMASLNANTTASRKSSVTAEGVVDFMNDYGGQVMQEYLRDNPDVHAALGGSKVHPLTEDSTDATEDDIRKATGYIPILPIKQQEAIYKDLITRYNELIERENTLGTNKLEAKALDLDAKTLSTQPVTDSKEDPSIFAQPANMEKVDVKRTVTPYTSQEVRDAVAERLKGTTSDKVMREQWNKLNTEGHAFVQVRIAQMAKDGAEAAKIDMQAGILNAVLTNTKEVLGNFPIGSEISLKDKLGQILYGVVTDIKNSGTTSNPAAGSSWKMQIALANGDAKSLTINFSQIGSRYTVERANDVSWFNPETQKSSYARVTDLFDRGSQVRREKRWMVTGNLLAGFANYPGQIVSYTKQDGTVGQGVMLNRQFDFEKEQRELPAKVNGVDAAMKFFDRFGDGAMIGTPDGAFVVKRQGYDYVFTALSAKREGGKYYLDHGLTNVLGDFHRKGSVFVATTARRYNSSTDSESMAREAIAHLMDKKGEVFVAKNHGEEAKKLFGQSVAAKETPKFAAKGNNTVYATDPGKADNSSATSAAITDLGRGLDRLFGGAYGAEHPLQGWINDGILGVQEIARAFGTQVFGYKVRAGKEAFDTEHLGDSNGLRFLGATYLNAETNRPHLAVLGHETAHQLRQSRPDLYNKLIDAVAPYVDFSKYKSKFANSKVGLGSVKSTMTVNEKDAAIQEEFMGEVLSDGFMDPGFWKALGTKNKQLLAQVWAFVGKILGKVLGINGTGYTARTQQYLTDYAKVMQIAGEIMGEYGMNPNTMAKAMGLPSPLNKASVEVQDDHVAAEQPLFNRQDFTRKVQNDALQFFANQDGRSLRTFNRYYDETISTQFNKALKDKHFGKVFGLVNALQNEVSLTSLRPSELAPGVLPRVNDVKSALNTLRKGAGNTTAIHAASQAVFAGTLHGDSVMQGRVWTEEELRNNFKLDDTGVALYKQARAAIDASLDELSAAEAYAMAQSLVPKGMRRQIINDPQGADALLSGELKGQIKTIDAAIKAAMRMGAEEQADELKAARKGYVDTARKVEQIFTTAKNLKAAGYAPLMRFGNFSVTVQAIDPNSGRVLRDEDGDTQTLFFSKYATEGEAKLARQQLEQRYAGRDDIRIEAGTVNDTAHELYKDITPETLALFADTVGVKATMEKYYQSALSDRSALKRRLERKGTSGYSDDMPRVLANFLTSNGRFAAQRYYMRDLTNAVKFIPYAKGDVQKEAQALVKFVMDGKDSGSAISALMFTQFLGGSVASAAVNLTQPVMMTLPYLSQFGAGLAAKSLGAAVPQAMGKKQITDAKLRDGLKRASQEGIVDAQEVFHLYSMGAQSVATGLTRALGALPVVGDKVKGAGESARARIGALGTLWGSMFSLAEGFNRRLTFIAAWNMAVANGHGNPYAFAVRAVNETQGIYNKANRPNWARNTVGRLLFTFKQYNIMYAELLHRMATKGGPEGKKAAAIMAGVLLLAAGASGLPFEQDIENIIDTIGQVFFKRDTNMARSKRRLAYNLIGHGLGDVALYGLSTLSPIDFGSRIGLGSLLPGSNLLKPSDEKRQDKAEADMLGPVGSEGQAVLDAFGAAAEGNWGKAATNLAPNAVKNLIQGIQMATSGHMTDATGKRTVDVSKGDAAWKAIGFNPQSNAQDTRAAMPIYQDRALVAAKQSSILNQWAQGIANHDDKDMKEAQDRYQAWNEKNPDNQIRITPEALRGAVRSMMLDRDTRLLKGSPKQLRAGVGLDLAAAKK